MPPTLLSVNVAQLQPVAPGSRTRTGIHKHPVGGAVLCDTLGLVGDAIGNAKHHGGPDQAIYLYSADDYAWWSATLGQSLARGTFGENLTISAWWDTPRVGDRVHFGDVTLELTAPRIPCGTLATRMGEPQFVPRFAAAARSGAYARVITTGTLEAGQSSHVTRGDPTWPTIAELFTAWYRRPRVRRELLEYTGAPMAVRMREMFVRWAAEAGA